jgi:hypothetical protein
VPLDLTPLLEGTETLSPLAEGAEALSPLAEGAETLTALAEFPQTDALPAPYPSLATYPSVAGTYPSLGTARTGVYVSSLAEGTETLTPLLED